MQHKTQSLTPEQAAAIIVRVREKHGLGEKYARTVWLGGNGKWSIVAPDGDSTTVDPMSERQLREWLEKVYFIEAITEHDATTEG